jgi:hypothetical protein
MLEIILAGVALAIVAVIFIPLFVDDYNFPHWIIRIWLTIFFCGVGFVVFLCWFAYQILLAVRA